MTNTRTIGQALRMLRKMSGLSQSQLADICDVAQESIADYELDKTEPRVDSLHRLLRFYGLRFAEFFAYLEDVPDPGSPSESCGMFLGDALLTARVKLGMKKSSKCSFLRTIRRQCAQSNVDWLAFWQLVDMHLEPRRL
jgi:DNA-binding XRE family transcriptional regulator